MHRVADEAGGGTELFRLETPRIPRKHFYPRQPSHPEQGAVVEAQLEVVYRDGMRIVEAAIPWQAIPTVRARMEAGESISFSYRVNHGSTAPTMELAMDRSAAEGISRAFNPDWRTSYPNVLRFQWERGDP